MCYLFIFQIVVFGLLKVCLEFLRYFHETYWSVIFFFWQRFPLFSSSSLLHPHLTTIKKFATQFIGYLITGCELFNRCCLERISQDLLLTFMSFPAVTWASCLIALISSVFLVWFHSPSNDWSVSLRHWPCLPSYVYTVFAS